MLTKEELEAVYKKFDDDKIAKLAMDESKNTGLIREYGIENIRDLIYNSNLVQMKSDENN
ncbi:MAG TPA: hypothetical protein PLL53_21300 [Saprospiraceae bacterium]|nr:hypothetical protein [Saprospiraceae bacterium]